MTSELQQNRYDQLIRRVGGIIGPGSKVSEAISELFPMIDVERVPAELLALMATRLATGHTQEAPVAAVNQRSQLFNPTGSNTIITCTQLSFRSNSDQQIQFGLVDVALGTLNNTRGPRDSRFDLGPFTVGEMRNGTNAGIAPVEAFTVFVQADVGLQVKDENALFVITPGFGLQATTTAQNTRLNCAYMWRERGAEQSELNF